MATRPASRFSFSMDLVVDEEHTYTVKSPSIEVGTFLVEFSGLLERAEAILETEEEIPEELEQQVEELKPPESMRTDQYHALLGAAYDQMVSDGMPFEVLKLAAATVAVWVKTDMQTAEEFWNSGGRVPKANRAARRKKTTSSRATS